MKFSKEKMLARIKKEGRSDLIDTQTIEIIENLDGCEAVESNWRKVVMGEPLLWVVGKNGHGEYVNEKDCE